MSNPTYIVGTQEYLRIEVVRAFGSFDTGDYTGEIALSPWGAAFDAATADWDAGVWETEDDHHYLRILLGVDLVPTAGEYTVYARLTGITEIPITRAVGKVTIA